ncbi:PEP/pyruvate-binding domain-containing protein [Candidatus Roizmanbacteria bacterium]|nr:PEP/pyruvate-binding domain-containing protein [Candidatus Roizmanbacteria bacterium]
MNPNAILFNMLDRGSMRIAGGKGASLGKLMQENIPMPNGFVILTTAFERFLEFAGLKEEITASICNINCNDLQQLEMISNNICADISNCELPADLTEDILKTFSKLNAQYVAVRSSAKSEDSLMASWAGEMESYLNTTEDVLLENIKKCWASRFNPRTIYYCYEKKLNLKDISIAVVIQKMVQSEISGVCFTANPLTRDRSQMVIEAGYGLGKAVVEGLITPDTYLIDKKNWTILDKNINHQKVMLINDPNNGTIEKQVTRSEQAKQKLSDSVIINLSKLCSKVEKIYNKPQDIEWAYEKGCFNILQSRPVTVFS